MWPWVANVLGNVAGIVGGNLAWEMFGDKLKRFYSSAA